MILEFTSFNIDLPDAVIPVYLATQHVVSLERRPYTDSSGFESEYTIIHMVNGESHEIKEDAGWALNLINTLG
jgi:hypothetical protein